MKRQSTIRPSAIYFSSIVKLRVRVRACNQSVLTNKGTVSSPRKQREPLMAFELTTDRLLIRHATNCATPPLNVRTCKVQSLVWSMSLCWRRVILSLRRDSDVFNIQRSCSNSQCFFQQIILRNTKHCT